MTVKFTDLGDGRTEVIVRDERFPADRDASPYRSGWVEGPEKLDAVATKGEVDAGGVEQHNYRAPGRPRLRVLLRIINISRSKAGSVRCPLQARWHGVAPIVERGTARIERRSSKRGTASHDCASPDPEAAVASNPWSDSKKTDTG